MKKIYTGRDIVKLWSRKCNITGEGMNEGWVWGDGVFYTKYEKDTIDEIRNNDLTLDHLDLDFTKMSDDELMELYFYEMVFYWTEWEEGDYLYAEMSDGNLINLSEIEINLNQ